MSLPKELDSLMNGLGDRHRQDTHDRTLLRLIRRANTLEERESKCDRYRGHISSSCNHVFIDVISIVLRIILLVFEFDVLTLELLTFLFFTFHTFCARNTKNNLQHNMNIIFFKLACIECLSFL